MRRPAVGITAGFGKGGEVFSLRDDYVCAVAAEGGLPLVLAPGREEEAAEVLDRLDGLVLSGGADLDPGLYGEPPHEALKDVRRERDLFELALTREALRRDLPLLAICRGHQVLNVAMGGTLVQDIPSQLGRSVDHDPDVERWHAAHEVEILPGTRLREILGRDRVAVNSFHHQAVKALGPGLVVSAFSAGDELVEGIEAPTYRFVVGVQWHPEAFWDKGGQFQALFRALVEATRPAPAVRGRSGP